MPQVFRALPMALPVWKLPRDEGADEDPHKEEGGGQWGFPVVLTHQVPLQEKGLCSDTATMLHQASSSTGAAGWRQHISMQWNSVPRIHTSIHTGTIFLVKVTVGTPCLKHRKKKGKWLPPQAAPGGQNTSSCLTQPHYLWRGWAASNTKPDGSPMCAAQGLPWTSFQYNPPIMYPPDPWTWLSMAQDTSTSETEQQRRVKNHPS